MGWNTTAAGDLDGLTDVDVTTTAPQIGDALVFDGTVWVPGQPAEVLMSDGGTLEALTSEDDSDWLYVG